MKRLDGIRLAYGTFLLIDPGRLAGRGSGAGDKRFRTIVRILGGRHVAQAVVTAARPTRLVRRAGAFIDLLHAATDVGCAVVDRRRRRPASIDAGMAALLAIASASASASARSASRQGR